MKNYEKSVNDKWRRALKYLEISENLFPNKKEEIKLLPPFNENSIANIKGGLFVTK